MGFETEETRRFLLERKKDHEMNRGVSEERE